MFIGKYSVAFDASDAGIFINLFVVSAHFDNSFELAGGNGRDIWLEILAFELWEGKDFVVGMREIKRYGVGNISGVKIGSAKKMTFYNGNFFLVAGEL